MYTLSTQDVQNFLTPDFMLEVPTAPESSNGLTDGALHIIKVSGVGAAPRMDNYNR